MNLRGRFVPYLVVASAFVSSGCESRADTSPVGSSEVGFDDLVVSVRASSNGVSALVDARVRSTSFQRPVNLEDGDAIFVEDGTKRLGLAPIEGGAVLVFPTEATRFDVIFVRGGAENRTIVELPAAFVLTAPARASRAEGFTVAFDADTSMETSFTIGGSCSNGWIERVAKVGATTLTVNGADLAIVSLPCTLDVRAERTVVGPLVQERTVEVEIVP